MGLVALLAAGAQAQQAQLVLDLRDGQRVVASALRGRSADGFVATVGPKSMRIASSDLLAVRGAAARRTDLLRADLEGGDVVYGALVGGDEHGDALELLSPVLGKVAVSIDRLKALVQPGVHDGDQLLPDGVDEAVFIKTGRGFDLVAGTLHRFGARGVQFEALASEAPQWFKPTRFSSVRMRSPLPAEKAMPCTLLTRTADRIGITVTEMTENGVAFTNELDVAGEVRWADVASLVFHERVVHLSDLEPERVVESGYESAVVHSWKRDRCVVGGELLAMGRAFGRGLGVHSKSRLTFRVPAGATHFRTRVAIDDSAVELPLNAHAAVRVVRNTSVVFEVKDLEPGRAPEDSGLIEVEAGQQLTLEVDFGRGRDLGDRIDWLLPMFLMRAGS